MERVSDILNRIGFGQPSPTTTDPGHASQDSPRPDGCWCGGAGGHNLSIAAIQVGGRIMTDPQGRAVFWETCSACDEGRAAERSKQAIHAEMWTVADDRLRSGWQHTGIPSQFQGFRLEDSPLVGRYPDVIQRLRPPANPGLEYVDFVERMADWTGWWYFYGGFGVGKTGLAVGYAWEWLNRERQDLRFVTAPDLLDAIRATFDRKRDDGNRDAELVTTDDVMHYYSTVPLLVIDDMGSEHIKGSGWAEERFNIIIGHRHANDLTTVFTSNYSLGELAGRLGDQGQRIAGRIRERCEGPKRIIHLEGVDQRY